MPELGLELVRDVDRERIRSRLPRWDPRVWGDAAFLKNRRPGKRLLKLGLAWGRERVKARKLQQENVTVAGERASVSRFTGKEEDVEVGLQYFGKRFLSPYLGRWISADPLAVHVPGRADLNLYAYVHGAVLKAVDPLGLEEGAGGAVGAEAKKVDEMKGENGGSQGAGAVVANGASAAAEQKNPCDMHSCVLRADAQPAFSMVEDSKQRAEDQKVEEARSKMSVTVNGTTPNLPGGDLMRKANFRHQWVVFDDGTAAGMGNDKGVPGEHGQTSPDLPGSPTQIVDHKGRVPEVSKRVDWVDVDTLKKWLAPGRKTGPWIPLVNDCNVTVNNAVEASTPQDRFGPEGTILKNVVIYPDGSFHTPTMSPPWVGASRAREASVEDQ